MAGYRVFFPGGERHDVRAQAGLPEQAGPSSEQYLAMRFEKGETIDGRYVVLDTLGFGGMGETFKARDAESGQTVVVKVPHASIIGDPATYARYQRETEIGKRLNHPNIQHVIRDGRLNGGPAPYLVLDFVEGETLRKYLAKRMPLSEDAAVKMALQIAGALSYVHTLGIVHRDLKPDNVVVSQDGSIKLMDFGIALLQGARRVTFGHLSSEVGTPDYMAPEQVQGERGDARTDVYALGIILFEMLAGELPFEGDNALAVMSQRVTAQAPLLRARLPHVDPHLEAVVARALRRDPDERFPSMDAMREALEHLPDQPLVPVEWENEEPVSPAQASLRTVGMIALVFLVLALIGVAAELAHQSQVAH